MIRAERMEALDEEHTQGSVRPDLVHPPQLLWSQFEETSFPRPLSAPHSSDVGRPLPPLLGSKVPPLFGLPA